MSFFTGFYGGGKRGHLEFYQMVGLPLQLKEVEDYMQYQKFPKQLRRQIRDYFENRYSGRVFNEDNILASLSDPLREVRRLVFLGS